jgi:hypothetical protein
MTTPDPERANKIAETVQRIADGAPQKAAKVAAITKKLVRRENNLHDDLLSDAYLTHGTCRDETGGLTKGGDLVAWFDENIPNGDPFREILKTAVGSETSERATEIMMEFCRRHALFTNPERRERFLEQFDGNEDDTSNDAPSIKPEET